MFEVFDGLAEEGKHRLFSLSGEIALAQAVIDVPDPEPFGQPVGKAHLFQRRAR